MLGGTRPAQAPRRLYDHEILCNKGPGNPNSFSRIAWLDVSDNPNVNRTASTPEACRDSGPSGLRFGLTPKRYQISVHMCTHALSSVQHPCHGSISNPGQNIDHVSAAPAPFGLEALVKNVRQPEVATSLATKRPPTRLRLDKSHIQPFCRFHRIALAKFMTTL